MTWSRNPRQRNPRKRRTPQKRRNLRRKNPRQRNPRRRNPRKRNPSGTMPPRGSSRASMRTMRRIPSPGDPRPGRRHHSAASSQNSPSSLSEGIRRAIPAMAARTGSPRRSPRSTIPNRSWGSWTGGTRSTSRTTSSCAPCPGTRTRASSGWISTLSSARTSPGWRSRSQARSTPTPWTGSGARNGTT